MTRTVAVIAHYDHLHILDPTFLQVIFCLKHYCDQIILVTTSNLDQNEILKDPIIKTIIRPNIGYDLYSYRVGINEIINIGMYDRLFLVNSSFLILSEHLFMQTLNGMISQLHDFPVIGITESYQSEHHLQSYLILLNNQVFLSEWFKKWVNRIEPQNTKNETQLSGELGLSRELHANNIIGKAVFHFSRGELLHANFLWITWSLRQYGLFHFIKNHLLSHSTSFNPTHFGAKILARRCGIIKTELLRDNPNYLDISWISEIITVDQSDLVKHFFERTRDSDKFTRNSLPELKIGRENFMDFRFVTTGPIGRPGVKIAVVLHYYYPELLDEICIRLASIIEPFDLFVTTPLEGEVSGLIDRCGSFPQAIAVFISENKGRDIAPFIALFRSGLLNPYNAILKIHTKRSTYSTEGEAWRKKIFDELLGSSRIIKSALYLFQNENIGIIGPHNYYLTHPQFWGADKEKARILLGDMEIKFLNEEIPLGFFAGSMFWFNPSAFLGLHDIKNENLRFEEENGQQDGTLAHSFERIFCIVARSAGYITTSLSLGGKEISDTDTVNNRVPVL